MYHPEIALGNLFTDVSLSRILEDDKTWADAIPLQEPVEILSDYESIKRDRSFKLSQFVEENFFFNDFEITKLNKNVNSLSIDQHIKDLWSKLVRVDSVQHRYSTAIALPFPYVVPGGRFREVYYWDSYFTMLGLREHKQWGIIESMVQNFAWMIRKFGFVPNGNRTYYLTRSQPPFFSLMVALLAEKNGNRILLQFRDALVAEHDYWTNRNHPGTVIFHDEVFSRYFDSGNEPRVEMFGIDVHLSRSVHSNPLLFHEIRSACASGWDFSSRWLEEEADLASTRITRLVPVDLECLLWHLEKIIAKAFDLDHDLVRNRHYLSLAEMRKKRIIKYFWNERLNFFSDFDLETRMVSNKLTLAGLYPLFFELAESKEGEQSLETLEKFFLKDGGLVTTLKNTGQQWDAPNGWAPLQWIGYISAIHYGRLPLANEIKNRWLKLNENIFYTTGKMLEKYNVEDIHSEGGGGEYPVQDGFGWTNGVFIALKSHDSGE